MSRSRRAIATLVIMSVLVLATTAVAEARKEHVGWKRGRIHLRTLARALIQAFRQQLKWRELPSPGPALPEAFARLRRIRPRQEFPWFARINEPNVGKAFVPLYALPDRRGWIYRRDVRRVYGRAALDFYDAMLERTDAGRSLSGVSWGALLQRVPDHLLPAMVAGQKLIPKMPAFSAIVRRFGKLRPMEIEMRGQIVGNTVGLLLRGGSIPRRTRVYGKSYSFDARAGALLHSKGFQVEGPRLGDNSEHLRELREQQQRLYDHLAQGTKWERSLLEALRDYGGLEQDDRWAQQEKRAIAKVEAHIDAQIGAFVASGSDPGAVDKPLFMMVDDGGEYLEIASRTLKQARYRPYWHLFTAVEQTSKGHRRMEREGPPFPVVSVAKSWAKTKYGNATFAHAISWEGQRVVADLRNRRTIFIPSDSVTRRERIGVLTFTPSQLYPVRQDVIAEGEPLQRALGAVCEREVVTLGKAKTGSTKVVNGLEIPRRAVVIGANGNIGSGLCRSLLASGYQVGGFDKVGLHASPAGLEMYHQIADALREGHLVFSCAGERTLGPEQFEELPHGAVVINGGSAGEIFLSRDPARSLILDPAPTSPLALLSLDTRRTLYEAARGTDYGHLRAPDVQIGGRTFVRFLDRLIPVEGTDPHEVWVTRSGKEVLAVRGGGVVNFPMDVAHPRSGHLIPGRYIQLEIGLLHLGMLQAAEGGVPGLRPLHHPPQRLLLDEVQAQLAARGESLLAPRWNAEDDD